MSGLAAFLIAPFAACVAFVLIHAYFGVHVLKRRIVFADLALAQLSALGATLAFANGYAPTSAAGFAYAFAFTVLGAAVLTLTRPLARVVSQEAFVGVLYVVATAATVLVVDRSPQGAEHVKQMLVGSILMVDGSDVARLFALYGAVGALQWVVRKPLLALSEAAGERVYGKTVVGWDFLFYVCFGVVVTSSVTTAGVLVVFSFLIVPAVIGALFARSLSRVLFIGWAAGIAASAAALAASYALDLPTGAAIVAALGLALLLAGIIRMLWTGEHAQRRARWRAVSQAALVFVFAILIASGAWLVANPAGDQPLFALLERALGGPARFLDAPDREIFVSAERDAERFAREVDRLNAMEREARYAATPLSDEDVRRIASYQQSFNEMVRGERFVQDVLRTKARKRERWVLGVPAVMLGLGGLAWLARRRRSTPRTIAAVSAHVGGVRKPGGSPTGVPLG